MANLGNTCFLNSCIQILNQIDDVERIFCLRGLKESSTENHRTPSSSSPEFIPVTNKEKSSLQNTDDALVLTGWLELRNAMLNPPADIPAPIINPLNFVRTIHKIARKKGRDIFTGWAQNDLPEFLLFLLECAHNAMARSVKMTIKGDSANKTDDLALQCYKMLQETYEREYSEMFDICYGVYVSRLFTPDGATLHSNKPESYCTLDLPIPVPNASHPLNLFDCFDEFIADELLSGWMNELTQTKEPVMKNIVFWNFPKILIIVLKRYSPDGKLKNGAMVQFPLDNLDLSKYVVGYKSSSYKYRLFGVANHMGGVNGGHYTAFVRGPEAADNWFLCNDSSVAPANEREVVSPSAYVLFYRILSPI